MKDNNKAKTIVVFDCRGLEPVDFSPRMGWKVGKGLCLYLTVPLTVPYNDYVIVLKVSGWKEDDDGEGGESGTVFEDVDLTDKEWADYDERSSPDIICLMTTFLVSGQMNLLSSRKSESALSQ